MKNRIKLLCVALVVLFSVSLCTLHVFATPDDIVPGTEAPVQTTDAPPVTVPPVTQPPVTQAPTPAPTQAPTPAPTQAPTPAPTQPPTEAPIQDEPSTEPPVVYTEPETQPQYETQAPLATNQPVTSANNYYNNSNDNSYNDQSNNYTYTGDEDDGQAAVIQSDLYDTDGKRVDTNTLKNKDWEEIKRRLQKSGTNGNSSGDFDFIKENNGLGDNGLWILIVGILLILTGVGIIIYQFIYKNKKNKNIGKNGKNPPSRGSSGGKRSATPAERKQINRRSKYDTADVFVPRRAPQRGRTSGGGTRYKPRH